MPNNPVSDGVPKRFGRSRSLQCAGPAVAGLLVCAVVHAEPLPLWEVGAGLAPLHLPDYRGSEQSRNYLLPFPWLVYRGEMLKADREGIRAHLFGAERVQLDVNLSGSVPVNSERNRARAGMPDLHPIAEFGPVLKINLGQLGASATGTRTRLDLQFPVRLAVAVGTGPLRDVGIVAAPALRLDLKGPGAAAERWSAGLALAGIAATQRYHAYFYEVAPRYSTPARPAFRARGGWGGWQATATASRLIGRWWIGAFVRYDDVRGAVFADSPLVTRRAHLSAGAGIAYVIAQSAQRVESDSE